MSDESAAAPDGRIEGKVHAFPVRVWYEDTDAGGVVYHANYVRFLERARTDFLHCVGITHALLAAEPVPVAFAVRRMALDFLRPARLEDRLTVRTVFREVRGPRVFMDQQILKGEALLVAAELEVACIAFDGRACRPPKVLVNATQPYLGGVLKST